MNNYIDNRQVRADIWKYCRVQSDRRAAPSPLPPRGGWTGVTEPCGALPRKC
jgi:hypothetical protein